MCCFLYLFFRFSTRYFRCQRFCSSPVGTRFCTFSPLKLVRAFITVPRFRPPPDTIYHRALCRIDLVSFQLDLLNTDWNPIFQSATVSEKWLHFVRAFTLVVEAHAPFRETLLRNPSTPCCVRQHPRPNAAPQSSSDAAWPRHTRSPRALRFRAARIFVTSWSLTALSLTALSR